jgi:thiol:disulfide interchange protein DsbC
MRLAALFAAFSTLALLGLPVHAQQADKTKAELKKKMPEAPLDAVRKIDYGNLYEVTAGGEIFYTDEKANFIVAGPIIDLKTKENVTEARLRVVNAIKFDTLPFDQAIKIVRGNGARKVAIFEDPNCGYCKRFERDLQGVSDITVYVFLYPILAADSMDKSKGVWCAPDKGKAWLDIMLRESPAPTADAKCTTTAIEQNLAYGQGKRITGTPTIIFENGERAPGALPTAEFEKRLAAVKTASAK